MSLMDFHSMMMISIIVHVYAFVCVCVRERVCVSVIRTKKGSAFIRLIEKSRGLPRPKYFKCSKTQP